MTMMSLSSMVVVVVTLVVVVVDMAMTEIVGVTDGVSLLAPIVLSNAISHVTVSFPEVVPTEQ